MESSPKMSAPIRRVVARRDPLQIVEGMSPSKELQGWRQKEKIDLYGWAGISAVGEVWFTHNADARCMQEGERGDQRAEEKFYV